MLFLLVDLYAIKGIITPNKSNIGEEIISGNIINLYLQNHISLAIAEITSSDIIDPKILLTKIVAIA